MNSHAAKSGLRILIAESYADAAESTAFLLRMSGHEVEIASNGADALARALANKPEAVLLELVLPLINGYELARQLRRCCAGRPPLLVAVTGSGQADDCRHSKEVGIDFHLIKPVDPDRLQAILLGYQRTVADSSPEWQGNACLENPTEDLY